VRVLYFHQYFATRESSSATRSYELARRLVEAGHAVTVVTSDANLGDDRSIAGQARQRGSGRFIERRTVDGIELLIFHVPYSNYLSYSRRLGAFAVFTLAASVAGATLPAPDVVFATSTPLTIAIPGMVARTLKKAPLVFEIRDLWPAAPISLGALRNPLLIAASEWLERLIYDRAEQVVVLSEGARDALRAGGVPAEKLVFVPNASDLDLFRPGKVDESFRREHGLEGKFLGLYAGAMGSANGLDQLVDAAAELAHAGRDDVALVAIGDGRERPRLEARVRGLGLDNVRFLAPVPKNRLAAIVGAADAALTLFAPHPALEANSPNKFFDSLAAGKPAIVNLDGWLRRLVETDAAGLYVPAGDGLALAAALGALADEPAATARMGANARRLAEREFDRDVMAERLRATLESAAKAGPRRATGGSPGDSPSGFYRRHGKRLVDLAVAVPATATAAPLLGALAVVVRATSGRPVLFVQDRVGLDGIPFGIYKFRSMIPDAWKFGGYYLADEDPRITWCGRWMRALSLDELPNLLNVVKGDMSLVGPRPNLPFIVDQYRNHYGTILTVKPGITGLVAVSGRNKLRRSQMIELDEHYVRTLSFREDLRILLKTIPIVLLRHGSSNDVSEEFIEDI
jgi:lipopolysaccharide/colanic/teichoic acid biosynthesis glycosyltransferase/glycosyltransferase involved in cell wall biosynthesis